MLAKWWAALTFGLVGASTAISMGQEPSESALSKVPEQAAVVFHVRGVERTKDRFLALVQNAVPDAADKLRTRIDHFLKEGMEGRQLKGLPPDGAFFVVLTEVPTAGKKPPTAIIVQVSNFQEFRDGLLNEEERKTIKKEPAGYETVRSHDHDFYMAEHSGYAMISDDQNCLEKFLKSSAGLNSKLSREAAEKILGSDVSLYVDMAAVNKQYSDQIQGVRQLVPMLLGQASEKTKMDKSAIEMAQTLLEGVFQALEDSKSSVLSMGFEPEGLTVHLEATVGPDTKTNGFLKDAKPAGLSELEKLPKDQMGYSAVHFGPELSKLYQRLLAALPADENKECQEAKEELSQASPKSVLMAFNLSQDTLQVWHYQDPAKAAAAQLKIWQALTAGGRFQNAVLKEKPDIKVDAENHAGFKLNSVSVKWDLEKMAENNPAGPNVAEAMKKMMGEGLRLWFGTNGQVLIQVTAANWDAARQHLDEYLEGKDQVGNVAPFQETWKRLPGAATVVALIDGPLYVQKLAEFIGPVAQGKLNVPPLQAARGKAYFGTSITLAPERGSLDFWLPATAVVEIRKTLQPVLENYGTR
jgi:hypothetical protein